MKKAIIIGASSGIGRELSKVLARNNYSLGLVARRIELLDELKEELETETVVRCIDISEEAAMSRLEELIIKMDGVDLIIISSGIGYVNKDLDWDRERETIDVNVYGVAAMVNTAFKHFVEKGSGQLVVLSSIAALRGGGDAPAYNASKAYISNYLEGLRSNVQKKDKNIIITDIRPGFVDTKMAQGEGLFWVQPLDKVAGQIYQNIKKKKRVAYVTKRWGIVALLLKIMPDWLYYKI